MNTLEQRDPYVRDDMATVTSTPSPHTLTNGASREYLHAVNDEELYNHKLSQDERRRPVRATEKGVTPIKPSMSPNVTPRSGTRKARAESTSPTAGFILNEPSKTPRTVATHGKPHGPHIAESDRFALKSPPTPVSYGSGGRSSNGSNSPIGFRSPPERSGTSMSAPISDYKSSFFHADDIGMKKPTRQATGSSLAKPLEASDKTRMNGIPSAQSGLPSDNMHSDEKQPKFFYANDLPEVKSPPHKGTNNATPNRPILPTIHSGIGSPAQNFVRPSSPLKDEILPDDDSSLESSPRTTLRTSPDSDHDLNSSDVFRRRSSLPRSPTKRSSIGTLNEKMARRSSVHSNQGARPRKSSIPTPISQPKEKAREDIPGRQETLSKSALEPLPRAESPQQTPIFSPPQSPTKPQSHIDHMNELAANARRDRKVLDLEISNSSLLAINHTLEREMRKMKSELRQYRRLSRSGRTFNLNARRSASGRLQSTDIHPEDGDLSDPEMSEEDDDDLISNVSSSQRSSTANRAVLSRLKDPQIEPLDFSAQNEMLSEGQKLNQTIKRCLGHSELMLVKAKQALDFSIQSKDIEPLGPRVLSPEEIEDDVIDRRQGLLSPTIAEDSIKNNPWESSFGRLLNLDDGHDEQSHQQQGAFESYTESPEAARFVDSPVGSNNEDPNESPIQGNTSRRVSVTPSLERITSSIPVDPFLSSQSSPENANDVASEDAESSGPPSPASERDDSTNAEADPPSTTQPMSDNVVLDETIQSTLAQLTGSSPPKVIPSEPKQDQPSEPLPQGPVPESQPSIENANANTPGNRSSIQKIFSSLWSGAASLRPP